MNAQNRSEIKRLLLGLCGALVFAATVPAVARVMPATLASWANPAMATAPLGVRPAAFGGGVAAASDDATAIRFRLLTTGSNTTVQLKIGTTVIATYNANGNNSSFATCSPGVRDVVFTDAATLALVNASACVPVAVTQVGTSYTGMIYTEVTRPSGVEKTCLIDRSNRNCAVDETNLCINHVATSNLTFQFDQDNDGINNCTDPDVDNDGDLNAVDNCPSVSNAAQTDSDSNGTGDACQARVVAVPWLGTEALPHQVVSGSALPLQAVATLAATVDDPVPGLKRGTWDPGDGSGPQPINISNSLALELNHVYTGAVGQPYTATISVTDNNGGVTTDTFKVVIGPNDRETKVNMAIDKALWNLHKNMQRTTSDSKPSGFWTGHSNYHMSSSASTVQAFEINNHREGGDPLKDPYVNDVKRGMRYILSQQHGYLLQMAVGLQNVGNPTGHPGDNPEAGQASPNGYGLRVQFSNHEVYLSGQLIDALVSSGTPDKTAETGQATYVKDRTYKEIVQDLLDGYSYGMNDGVGGWHYTYNAGDNDTSASHWWAIGVLAGEVWGLDAPQWVKDRQKNIGIPLMQVAPPGTTEGCYFGYTGSTSSLWGDNQTNVTAGGLILMNADDIPQSDARFKCAEKWLDSKWTAVNSYGNFYTMFQTAKAMRTARNGSGGLQEIELLNGTRNWYNDYADYLINNQDTYGTGEFRAVTGGIGPSYIQGNLATSWGVIILSPSLFELPPAAACVADPNTLGTAGGLVNFSAAGSTHPDSTASIVSYAWDFGDGNTAPASASATASHTYTNPGTFPTTRQAKVTVTDSNGLTDSAFCPVTIVDTNVPPNPETGGPYTMCMGAPLTLNGSTSSDSDGSVAAYSWIWDSNPSFIAPNASTATVDATAAFTALGPGTYSLGLQVTDNDGAKVAEFSTVTVLAANDAACNQPPDAIDDAASTFSGTPVVVSVLSNDTDPDVPADTVVVTETTQGANGSVLTDGTSATYSPNLGFFGTDTFTYSISDGQGGTDTATVIVTVSRRPATVTAASGTKVYGDSDPSLTPSAVGFVDAVTLSQTRVAGEDVGSYTTIANATGATLANYDITYVAGNLSITPADSTTVVTCTASVVYNGAAQEVCTANVTGAGGLNAAVSPVTYTDNINVGTATASASYAGDLNHTASSDTETFAITLAPSTTVVTCTASVVYTGSPIEVCTANVTGVGLNAAVTPVVYSNNTNIGTAGASATYGGDANHSGSTGSSTFEITAAPTSASVTAPTITYAANGAVTVTVTSASGTVLGNVSLTVDGGAPMTQTLSGGSTTFALTSPNAGDHALVATYAAQGNFQASSASGNLHVNQSPTATTLTSSPSPQAAGQTVTLTATVVATAPGSGVPDGTVTFMDGATTLGTATVNAGVAVFTTTSLAVGPHSITAIYSGSSNYITSAAGAVSQLIYGYPTGGGTFVIGDNNDNLGGSVTFWGAQWEKLNSMTGGGANASFKGFATGPTPPAVGGTFTAAPGNSAPSPAAVPEYIGIIVTSKVTKSGSNITGTIVGMVVVKVNPGYAGNPGNAGTGTIVAILP